MIRLSGDVDERTGCGDQHVKIAFERRGSHISSPISLQGYCRFGAA
jgi:hypothetical protein